MSAVRKEEIIIPMRPVDPDEPRFTPIEDMFCPPFWGKHEHSEDDLRQMWSRIWRCFKSRRLCEEFLLNNRKHPLEVWCAAFETCRAAKDGKFEHIRYVKKIADRYEIDGTPAQVAEKESKEQERLLKLKQQGALLAAMDPEDPDIKAFKQRNKEAPLEEMASHPMTLRYKNRIRGDQ